MQKMFFARKKDAEDYMTKRKPAKREELKAVKAYRDGRTKVEGYVLQTILQYVREDGKLS